MSQQIKQGFRVWILPLIALGLVLASWLLQPAPQPLIYPLPRGLGTATSSERIAEGVPAPDFTLETLDGGEVTLSGLRGKAVIINFWASWCGPCRIETPLLVETYNKYRNQGLVILGMNITQMDNLDDVRAFAEEFSIPYPLPLDKTGEVSQDYQLFGIPNTFFIDREGIIKKIYTGTLDRDLIDEYLALIL